MKNSKRIIYGLLLTAVAFLSANFAGRKILLNSQSLPPSFITHSAMLILSIVLICCLRKYVNYKIAWPKFKKTLKPMLLGFLAVVIINALLVGLGKVFGIEAGSHFVFDVMTPLQVFLFICILASVAEEVLFRGFLQNILKPLQAGGIKFCKRHLSMPVMIAALAFSLAHLILIVSGAGAYFIFRTLAFTFVLGLIAGYYQEKYDNNAYAILVHMSGNLLGLITALLATINV